MASSDYYIADNSDMENKKLEAARSHYMSGNYSAALKLYLSLINTSASYKLYHRIGKCYYKMDDFEKAEEYFLQSIALEKSENPSFTYLGNINYKKENIKQAIYYWSCAFAFKPEDENICLNLATSYFSLGKKFQSVFYYEKYLKNTNNKGDSYTAIKSSIDKCNKIASELLQKAKLALSRKNNISAIEFLDLALKNMPISFDINSTLGSVYLSENDYMHALIYLKQAYFIDNRSLDTLQKLAQTQIQLGDYTAGYCTMRRIQPLIINNQTEYLKTMQAVKELRASFDDMSYQGHKIWGDRYFEENSYHSALMEYENCILLKEDMEEELHERISLLKSFISPEEDVIKYSLEKGEKLYEKGEYKDSNKYFTKVMQLSSEKSKEYKTAKSKIINV